MMPKGIRIQRLERGILAPHFGHAFAEVETCVPQSLQVISDISISSRYVSDERTSICIIVSLLVLTRIDVRGYLCAIAGKQPACGLGSPGNKAHLSRAVILSRLFCACSVSPLWAEPGGRAQALPVPCSGLPTRSVPPTLLAGGVRKFNPQQGASP